MLERKASSSTVQTPWCSECCGFGFCLLGFGGLHITFPWLPIQTTDSIWHWAPLENCNLLATSTIHVYYSSRFPFTFTYSITWQRAAFTPGKAATSLCLFFQSKDETKQNQPIGRESARNVCGKRSAPVHPRAKWPNLPFPKAPQCAATLPAVPGPAPRRLCHQPQL